MEPVTFVLYFLPSVPSCSLSEVELWHSETGELVAGTQLVGIAKYGSAQDLKIYKYPMTVCATMGQVKVERIPKASQTNL
eukprot:968721-Amphidinium_carterae.1